MPSLRNVQNGKVSGVAKPIIQFEIDTARPDPTMMLTIPA